LIKQSKVNIDLLSASRLKQTSNALERSVLLYGITQCYLPPDRGESPDFTPWSVNFML